MPRDPDDTLLPVKDPGAVNIPLYAVDAGGLDVAPLPRGRVVGEAIILGERFDPAFVARIKKAPPSPAPDGAFGFVAPYGVIVLFEAGPLVRAHVLTTLAAHVVGAVDIDETEGLVLEQGPGPLTVHNGQAQVERLTLAHCDVAATALAQSVALAHREAAIVELLQTAESWATGLADGGRVVGTDRALIKSIGGTLKNRFRFLRDVELDEKPDVVWDRPDLDRLYAGLRQEYELSERHATFNRKMALLDDTARMLVELSANRRSLRLEWLIVALIAVEVFIMLSEWIKS